MGNLRAGEGEHVLNLSKHQTPICEESQLDFLIPGKEPFLLEGDSEYCTLQHCCFVEVEKQIQAQMATCSQARQKLGSLVSSPSAMQLEHNSQSSEATVPC